MKLFGTDGIRGRAGEEPLDPQTVVRIGMAVGEVLKRRSSRPRVVLGRDTRASGPMLAAAFSSGLCAVGSRVIDAGVITTPAVAYLTRLLDADAGAVISASHNPFEDNGIKLFSHLGHKFPDDQEEAVEALVANGGLKPTSPERIGSIQTNPALAEAYADYLVKAVAPPRLTGIKLVLDAANGAAFEIARQVFERLGASLITIGVDPDGKNINDGVGATAPERMAALVKETGADAGVAFDGDADRLIMADENGHIVDGDHILGFCARYMAERGMLKGGGVVATVMSNLGLEKALAELGLRLERTKVGDRFVAERMREGGFNLGGEQSGHLIFSDYTTTGDGILSALFVLRVMADTGKPLSELASFVKKVPQVLKNVRVKEKRPIEELPAVMRAIEDAKAQLGDSGRVLVRYSGTENKARIMLEGDDAELLDRLAMEIADAFIKELG